MLPRNSALRGLHSNAANRSDERPRYTVTASNHDGHLERRTWSTATGAAVRSVPTSSRRAIRRSTSVCRRGCRDDRSTELGFRVPGQHGSTVAVGPRASGRLPDVRRSIRRGGRPLTTTHRDCSTTNCARTGTKFCGTFSICGPAGRAGFGGCDQSDGIIILEAANPLLTIFGKYKYNQS